MPSSTRENPYVAALNASVALEARLKTLEAQHAEFQDALRETEQSVKLLPDSHRVRARRRLRQLGLQEQPGPLADPRAVLDDGAA